MLLPFHGSHDLVTYITTHSIRNVNIASVYGLSDNCNYVDLQVYQLLI